MTLQQDKILPKSPNEIILWQNNINTQKFCISTIKLTGTSDSNTFKIEIIEYENESNLNTNLISEITLDKINYDDNNYINTSTDGTKIIFNNVSNGLHGTATPINGISCMPLGLSSTSVIWNLFSGFPYIYINSDNKLEFSIIRQNMSNPRYDFTDSAILGNGEIYYVKIFYLAMFK